MKSIFIITTLLWLNSLTICSQEAFTIDHTHNNLSDIPDEWIEAAKSSLYIAYGHTSHGSQLISGMNAINNYFTDNKYDWSHTGGEGKLHLFEGDGYGDGYLDHDIGYAGWDDETREYLDNFPDCNVIVWSWCGQVNSTNLESHMFEPMEQLETEYPDVQFVYMTGHLEGLGADGSVNSANEKIRNYCENNNKILFDFADIEKYDPDAILNYQDYFASDNCDYDPDGQAPASRSENWAKNWVADNPQHELSKITSKCTSCAHSVNLNCVKKGVATWYLWARLAGWDGHSEAVEIEQLVITSKNNATSITTSGGTLQLYANAIPENAIVPEIDWSITVGDQFASINENGLITAKADGTVKVLVSANDIPELNANFEITISNQKVAVTDIQLSSTNDIISIKSDETLQLLAQVIPENATNQSINWSISVGNDIASIDAGGLLIASGVGQVTVVATSVGNPEIKSELNITLVSNKIEVSQISINSENNTNTIDTDKGELQLSATILPEDATNPAIEWSISHGMNFATIDETGLVKALKNGDVTVVAVSKDNNEIEAEFTILISSQYVSISEIIVSSINGENSIDELNGTLQLNAEIIPENSTNENVNWSVPDCEGIAEIDSNGLLTAKANGSITVVAADPDDPSVYGTYEIEIINQASTSISNSNDFVYLQKGNIIQINNSKSEGYILNVIDLSGRIAFKSVIHNGNNVFNLQQLIQGCYVLHVYSGQRVILSQKIVLH